MNEEEKKLAEQKAADEAKAKAEAEAKAKAEKPDSEKTVDELKAEAEAAEAALKAAKEKGGVSEEELKANYIRRKEKAIEKANRLKETEDDEPEHKPRKAPEIAVEDLVTLEVRGIDKNSDEAKVLKRYVDAGIVGNYKEGLNHVAVKAELEALGATKKAKAVIDENDTEEVQLKSKKEIVSSYKATGEVPTDKKAQAEIAKSNLKEMGL